MVWIKTEDGIHSSHLSWSRVHYLNRIIDVVRLSCSDSEFKVTPIQEKCPGKFLFGMPMSFILDVDEEAPWVSCGFRDQVPEKWL
jgi:hypothetical protein